MRNFAADIAKISNISVSDKKETLFLYPNQHSVSHEKRNAFSIQTLKYNEVTLMFRIKKDTAPEEAVPLVLIVQPL
jgi:hypothetical protein